MTADYPALSLWPIFVNPALESSPSALSHIPSGSPPNTRSSEPPQFTSKHFDQWIEFQTKKNKAVSKDTWNLFVDFMRTIDAEFKQYDEAGEPFLKGQLLLLILQRPGHQPSMTLWNTSGRSSIHVGQSGEAIT